jgi:hypothetical protein
MARIYFDPALDARATRRLPPSAIEGLPLDLVRTRLEDVQRQRLIPFLGAGASLPSRRAASPRPEGRHPSRQDLEATFRDYNIDQPIQLFFLEAAIRVAQLMGSNQPEAANLSEAPSSWELASLLAKALDIDSFEPYGEALMDLIDGDSDADSENAAENVRLRACTDVVAEVARLMGLHRSVPQLLTVASYFNARDRMIGLLYRRFQRVTIANPIHKLLADSAHRFVDARNRTDPMFQDKRDFVIITTNYDSLIESELDRTRVPTCVVTVDPSSQMMIDFTANTQQYLGLTNADFDGLKKRYTEDERRSLQGIERVGGPVQQTQVFTPKKFQLANKSHSLAMVYKIHGSLEQRTLRSRDADGLVISDHDYVEFIQNNGSGNELIPAYITSRLMESRLLFLGYSFSDWNVRGLYRHFLRNRKIRAGVPSPEALERDFIVMRSFGKTDDLFFELWDVSVMIVDLDNFARTLA